jgi:hypothetical protein
MNRLSKWWNQIIVINHTCYILSKKLKLRINWKVNRKINHSLKIKAKVKVKYKLNNHLMSAIIHITDIPKTTKNCSINQSIQKETQ